MTADQWKYQYKEVKKFLEDRYDVAVNLRNEYKYEFTIHVFMKRDISSAIKKAVSERFSTWHPVYHLQEPYANFHFKHGAKKVLWITFYKM